jgi:hypothetical protein
MMPRWYGSIDNRIAESAKQPEITAASVGMGATLMMWSDRHPATVVEVYSRSESAFGRTRQRW